MRVLLFYLGLFAILPLAVATFQCLTPSGTTMVHNVLAEQRKRSASSFQAHLAEPWPLVSRNGRRLRVVKYCFADASIRQKLKCPIQDAFTLWADRLGYPASQTTGHNLAWEEAHDRNPEPSKRQVEYCYQPGSRNWNPKVDRDTLSIDIDEAASGAWATTGWRPHSEGGSNSRRLIIGSEPVIAQLAHELGHVFGMEHEFVRNDRDDHVLYQCRNVRGYQEAYKKAEAANPGWLWPPVRLEKALCKDADFATKYDFDGSQYAKNPWGKVHDDSPAFDMDSIMMYPSISFANSQCPANFNACPLLRYVQAGQYRIKALIPVNRVPSDGDIAWLKKWYPWID